MTHNLTHTAKEADGISGVDRTKNIIFTEQKGPETAEHQRFPGLQSVGKDEVGGSNPPSSSKKSLVPQRVQGFSYFCELG